MAKKKKGGTTPNDTWDPWRPMMVTGNAWEVPEFNFQNILQIVFMLLVFALIAVFFGIFKIDYDDDYDYEKATREPPPPYPDYMGVRYNPKAQELV